MAQSILAQYKIYYNIQLTIYIENQHLHNIYSNQHIQTYQILYMKNRNHFIIHKTLKDNLDCLYINHKNHHQYSIHNLFLSSLNIYNQRTSQIYISIPKFNTHIPLLNLFPNLICYMIYKSPFCYPIHNLKLKNTHFQSIKNNKCI